MNDAFELFKMGCFHVRVIDNGFNGGSNSGQRCPEASGDRLLNAWRYDLASPSLLTNDCPALLRELMDKLFFAWSLWWTAGSTRVLPTLLVCQGLPPPQGYAAMLDGNWQQWGWEDRHVFPVARSAGAE